MRAFTCGSCATTMSFGASACTQCGTPHGYLPSIGDLRPLVEVAPSAFEVETGGPRLWRCLNASWRCNWMVPAGPDVWCRACRLTRGRPAESDLVATENWMQAESVKRRLVHQLVSLGLPANPRSELHPHGLVFDLVHVPGAPCVTGHRDGVVTIDITESDDQHRDSVRRSMGETFRTMIGHFRHEIGHQLWIELIGTSDLIEPFRALFGDERADYTSALRRHHESGEKATTPDFISGYAMAHPHEDWAESFAHLLHLHDAAETAHWHGWTHLGRNEDDGATGHACGIAHWLRVVTTADDIAVGLGAGPVYPFRPGGLALEKLEFARMAARHWVEHQRSGTPESHGPLDWFSASVDAIPSEPDRAVIEARTLRESARRDLERAERLRLEASTAIVSASFDHLTGALLRREGFPRLEAEVDRCRRSSHGLTFGFVDVDGLKAVNDTRGHAEGDRLLIDVARTLRSSLRSDDVFVRYGGDEFVFTMADTSRAAAAERVEEACRTLRSSGGGSVSAGFAELKTDDTLSSLLARADDDLYRQRQQRRHNSSSTTSP